MATRFILNEASALFTQHSGLTIAVESIGGVDAAKRIRSGDIADVVILANTVIDQLVSEQFLLQRQDWVTSGIAVAIAADKSAPLLTTEMQVKEAVTQAESICYSTGPSGVYLEALFAGWGLSKIVGNKTVVAPPGVPVASLVASGQAQLGFQQLSELLNQPGIQVVGHLPEAIQLFTTFSLGVHVNSKRRLQAEQLIAFLTSGAVNASVARFGMQAC